MHKGFFLVNTERAGKESGGEQGLVGEQIMRVNEQVNEVAAGCSNDGGCNSKAALLFMSFRLEH